MTNSSIINTSSIKRSKILLSCYNKIYSKGFSGYTEDVVPLMTSNNTQTGYIISASSLYDAGYQPYNVFDNSTTRGWMPYEMGKSWLRVQFLKPQRIIKYTITGSPKDWTFEGSDNGVNWTILDTQINQTWPNGYNEYSTFKNDNVFTYYRINVTANTSAYTSLIEMQLMSELPKLVNCIDTTELTSELFTKWGNDLDEYSSFLTSATKYKMITEINVPSESGKAFEHKIDLSKRRVEKINL